MAALPEINVNIHNDILGDCLISMPETPYYGFDVCGVSSFFGDDLGTVRCINNQFHWYDKSGKFVRILFDGFTAPGEVLNFDVLFDQNEHEVGCFENKERSYFINFDTNGLESFALLDIGKKHFPKIVSNYTIYYHISTPDVSSYDILLAYVKDGKLKIARQRDRYNIEYDVDDSLNFHVMWKFHKNKQGQLLFYAR